MAGGFSRKAARSFAPDPKRALDLDREVNTRLVSSLRYVVDQVGAELGVGEGQVEPWLEPIESGRRPAPKAHALFHTLVADIQAQDLDGARTTAAQLLSSGFAEPGLRIGSLDEAVDGDRPLALFSRFADIEDENRLDLIAPYAQDVPAATSVLEQSLALIERNDPDLDGEIRGLMSELLFASQAPTHRFATAALSCFQNWGALLVNPIFLRDDLDGVETLAHESTHSLLFALCLDGPLLTNTPEERHYSPLRQAQRSMEGVYHATMVEARVARAHWRQAEALDATEVFRMEARRRASRAGALFAESLEIVQAKAQLTDLGRDLLDGAVAFMSERPQFAQAAASRALEASGSTSRSIFT